jgi:hypothetical protein
MKNIFGTENGCNVHNVENCARCHREAARAYFLRTSNGDQKLFEDRMNRYDSNYNGMRDHWDRVLPFILGTRAVPLNESRGETNAK